MHYLYYKEHVLKTEAHKLLEDWTIQILKYVLLSGLLRGCGLLATKEHIWVEFGLMLDELSQPLQSKFYVELWIQN